MSEIAYLRARAVELRNAAETARDPAVVRALKEVAAEFDHEARINAIHEATHHASPQHWVDAA